MTTLTNGDHNNDCSQDELNELSTRLRTADSVPKVLDALISLLGLTRVQLGTAVGGVTAEAVRRWSHGAIPQGTHYTRLGELRSVVLMAAESQSRTVEGIHLWLTFEDPALETSPLEALGRGRVAEVRALLREPDTPGHAPSEPGEVPA